MTEDEARAWLQTFVSPDAFRLLERYVAILLEATTTQNLIAPSTVDTVWTRHIADSAQLLSFVSGDTEYGRWVDVGSGAGPPGLVVAICTEWPVTLVEPRRLRATFLQHCVDEFGLHDRTTVFPSRVESVTITLPATVLSARAVAALPKLFAAAQHLTDQGTLWLLPKGRTAQSEVADARKSWQGRFHVEHSIVDPTSGIVVARQVARR